MPTKSGIYRKYLPNHTYQHNNNIYSIINNLNIESIQQIETLHDKDIDFLIHTLCTHNINTLYQRINTFNQQQLLQQTNTFNNNNIRKIKILFLVENILHTLLHN